MASHSSRDSNHNHDDNTQTTKKATAPSWSVASRTAAACLATAAILSSCLPASAGVGGGHLDIGLLQGNGAAPTSAVMLLADEGDSTSSDGRADVSELVSELKKANRADSVLNSMVKINDVVDADEDGVLENPFAAEVRCRACCIRSIRIRSNVPLSGGITSVVALTSVKLLTQRRGSTHVVYSTIYTPGSAGSRLVSTTVQQQCPSCKKGAFTRNSPV